MVPTTGEIRRAATTAGIALLVMAVLAGLANFAVVARIVVEGDAAQTATNLAASEGLFRLAVAGLLVVAALDVVVAWGLFRVFEPASGGLSRLAAWFRVVYAGVFVVAIAELAGVARLLQDGVDGGRGELSAQVLAGVDAFHDLWSAGLGLFGVHLLLLGALVFRASYASNVLGVLVVVAGLGYAVDAFGVVLVAGYDANVAAFTFLGEVVLIFWLLLRGRRLGSRGGPERRARTQPLVSSRPLSTSMQTDKGR